MPCILRNSSVTIRRNKDSSVSITSDKLSSSPTSKPGFFSAKAPKTAEEIFDGLLALCIQYQTHLNDTKHKKTLSESRSPVEVNILKGILILLTLGLALVFGILDVAGAKLAEKIEPPKNKVRSINTDPIITHKLRILIYLLSLSLSSIEKNGGEGRTEKFLQILSNASLLLLHAFRRRRSCCF
jgi:hypothetical protein